jgi:pimeloyl-ACP methyl ester carboxylesterase
MTVSPSWRPWGFELDEIRMPVQVWQGRQDRFVPYGHGEWLAAHIPGVEPHLTEKDGHITLIRKRIAEVHRWLLDRLGAWRAARRRPSGAAEDERGVHPAEPERGGERRGG